MTRASTSSPEDEGPMVATILVRRPGAAIPPRLPRPREGGPAGGDRPAAPLFFRSRELVVLGAPVRAGRRPGLDLTCVHSHGEIRDRRILGLAGAMGDDRRVP